MADYYTQAVLSTGSIADLPPAVHQVLKCLRTGDADELNRLLEELGGIGDTLRTSLVEAGVVVGPIQLDEDALLSEYCVASGNSVDDMDFIVDDRGVPVPGVGGQSVIYDDELAREYLSRHVFFTDETETACMEMTVVEDEAGTYVYWGEQFSSEAALVLQWLLRQLPETTAYLQVDAANTCSRPLEDGFGGFCVVVTRDEVHWLHAHAAADRVTRRLRGEGVPTATVLRQLDVDDDGIGSPVARLLANFIDSLGLDEELRRFVEARR